MPIKGLTDRGLSFPEIGQIRKGIKVEQKKGNKTIKVPKDLDYFRVEFDEREKTAAAKFVQVYGNEPREINIILPFDEIERMWDAWLEAYTAGRMVARSDGEKFTYWIDTETGLPKVKNGEPFTPYKPGQPVGKDYQGKPVFANPVGRLKLIIPELGRAAYLTMHTTSIHDIANLSMQLAAFKQINNGIIKGIPLVLRRRPKMISIPKDDGQRVRMQKWLLSIEADPNWVKAKLTEVKHLALPGNGMALLPDGEEIEGDVLELDEDVEQMHLMHLETALQVQNSDGVPYGDLESEKLRHMWGAIQGRINEITSTGQHIEDFDELAYKRDAINVILLSRSQEEQEV